MRTVKRTVPNIDTVLEKKTKFFNQMKWDGIIEDDNIYNISQYSVRNAKNVYVDDSNHLVSRLPLSNEEIGRNALPENYVLKDILTFGDIKVYVSQYSNNDNVLYNINLNNSASNNMTINGISKYNINKIDHYIICFNDKGAKVFDTNNRSDGWQNFSNFVEVPVVKITTGSVTTRYEGNEFTESYKEQYIWADEERAILPEGDGDVEIQTTQGEIEYKLNNMNKFTEYRILRPLNIELEDYGSNDDFVDLFTVSKDNAVMCIGKKSYFLVSYNGGSSWKKIDYPSDAIGHSIEVASVTEDGQYFFIGTNVNNNGIVYRCNLSDGTFSWIFYNCYEENSTTQTPISDYGKRTIKGVFLNGETFAFCNFNSGKLYYKAPTSTRVYLKDISNYTVYSYEVDATVDNGKKLDYMSIVCKVYDNNNLFIALGVNHLTTLSGFPIAVLSCQIVYNSENNYTSKILTSETLSQTYRYAIFPTRIDINSSQEILVIAKKWNTGFVNAWSKVEITFNFSNDSVALSHSKYISSDWEEYVPLELSDNDVYLVNFNIVYNPLVVSPIRLPDKLTIAKDTEVILYDNESSPAVNNKKEVIMANDTFYMIIGNRIFTNNMLEKNTVKFTYEYISGNEFTKVPNVSYSGTELYLGFNNLLQITENTRDKEDTTKILFNLPSANNLSFIGSINGMMNISTTEVALFFKNEIIICSKVKDENRESGYAYHYYKTKLSTGIRLGDTVMNTLEGSLTVFPTRRGLALMNYQAFMATTDQVITYISDNIKDIWTDFYDENGSTKINIIQWRNYLVITNEKKKILLYNLVANTWWLWEVPINITKMLTDQIELDIVSQLLYRFKEANVYYDFANTYNEVTIKWFIKSQPLFMNAPTYYKNLKQLVFQFYDDGEPDKKRTLNTKIILYRKKITDRDPETIAFKVDEYRTFVKRFNYWKINEVQWELSNDDENALPSQLKLNGINVK